MFAKLTAKTIYAAIGVAMAFFGVGLLGVALADALVATVGRTGAYAIAGAVLLVPPLIWAVATRLAKPKKPPPPPGGELTRVLLAAIAKETPWVAIIGAGIAGAANMFLNRNKGPK